MFIINRIKKIMCSSSENLDINNNLNNNLNNNFNLLGTRTIFGSTDEFLNSVKDSNWNNTIPYVPPIEKGLVIKVYDGDSITIVTKLPFINSPIYRFSVRLNGIDCPEIKGLTSSEKECAQIAKKELSNLILNKVVILKNVKTEKYGRILADVYLDDLYINSYMIQNRLAVEYDGGTKKAPEDWLKYYTGI